MRALVVAGVLVSLAAGCVATPPPRPSLNVSWEQVEPLIAPMTYRMLIMGQCDPLGGVPEPFDIMLASAGAPDEVVAEAHAEIERIRSENAGNPDEYVCTPEMFEMSEAAAAEAQAVWDELKG